MPLVPVPVDQKWTWVVPSPGLVEIRGVGVAGPAGPTGAPGPNQLLTGKTLWVDLVNGNNGTAVRGDATKPYLDPAAAQTAALAGDTIVVRPGAYVVTAPLGKHLVNWNFEAGSSVTRTETDPLADVSVWDDGGAAMTFTVTGAGDFKIVLTSNVNNIDADVIRVRHASSVITIDSRDLDASNTVGGPAGNAIRQDNGNLVVRCRDADGSSSGVWWINGKMSVIGRECRSTRYAVYSTVNAAPTGDAYVRFNNYVNTGLTQAVLVEGENTNAALWVRGETIRGGSDGVAVSCLSVSGGNRLYVECQKVFGQIQESNGYSSLLYVRSDKVSPVVTNMPLFYSGSGFAWVQVNDWDGASLTTNAFEVPGGTADIFGGRLVAGFTGFSVNSGTLRLHGVHATINGTGVLILNGSARLNGCFIDSSASSIASPVFKTGGTLTLTNTTLVANATRNAIEVIAAQNVAIEGTLTANRPSHASVTFSGGMLVRTDTGEATTDGSLVVRQFGGTQGTDELLVSHNGLAALLRNRDTGGIGFLNAAGTVTTFSVTDGGIVTTGSTLIVKQPGGTVGVDELAIGHDGSVASFWNREAGGYDFLDQAGTGLLLDLAPSLTSFYMPVNIRQVGGSGTDAGRLSHNGTTFDIRNLEAGGIRFRNAADTVDLLTIGDTGEVQVQDRLLVNPGGGVPSGSSILFEVTKDGGTKHISVDYFGGVVMGEVALSRIAVNYGGNTAEAGAINAVGNFTSNTALSTFNHRTNTGWAWVARRGSSTEAVREVFDIPSDWADATDATRAGRFAVSVYSVTTRQEGLRIDANAAGVRTSVYGVAAVARQTVTGSRGGNAALADLLTKLATWGVIIDSTTA